MTRRTSSWLRASRCESQRTRGRRWAIDKMRAALPANRQGRGQHRSSRRALEEGSEMVEGLLVLQDRLHLDLHVRLDAHTQVAGLLDPELLDVYGGASNHRVITPVSLHVVRDGDGLLRPVQGELGAHLLILQGLALSGQLQLAPVDDELGLLVLVDGEGLLEVLVALLDPRLQVPETSDEHHFAVLLRHGQRRTGAVDLEPGRTNGLKFYRERLRQRKLCVGAQSESQPCEEASCCNENASGLGFHWASILVKRAAGGNRKSPSQRESFVQL